MDEQQQQQHAALAAFLVAYPAARLADVMAEFDLSDTEAEAALREVRGAVISLRARRVQRDAAQLGDDLGDAFAYCPHGKRFTEFCLICVNAPVNIDDASDEHAAPENGETLCGLEYRAYYQAWVYLAGYSDARLCRRRAESLEQSFGVPFSVYRMPDGDYYAAADWRSTDALRAVMALDASDDLAAHLRETVDELRGGREE